MSDLTLKSLAAAVAGAIAVTAFTAPVSAAETAAKEKCYGVAKAGENECAAANGTHGCHGKAKADYDGQEWKRVAAGTCEKMGGKKTAFEGKGTPPAQSGG